MMNRAVKQAIRNNLHDHISHTLIDRPVSCGLILYYDKIIVGKKCMLYGYVPNMSTIKQILEKKYSLIEGDTDIGYSIHNGGIPECESITLIKSNCFCDKELAHIRSDNE